MDSLEIIKEIKKSICGEIEIFIEGINRIIIVAPFTFDDGDHLNVVLKYNKGEWYFTDEGSTLMHLSYHNLEKSIEKGKRKDIFEKILRIHQSKSDQGEIKSIVRNEDFGRTYFIFIQGILQIINLATVTQKDYVKSMFCDDLKSFLRETFGERCVFKYHNQKEDQNGKYIVDCAIKHDIPLFIFGISNDDKCRDATITCHMYLEWGIQYNSIAIFEDQEKINKKVLARFSDVIDKQYSTLQTARNLFPSHLEKLGIEMN